MFNKYIPNEGVYKGSAVLVMAVSILEALVVAGVDSSFINSILASIPFSSVGFSWLVPAIAGGVVGGIVWYLSKNNFQEAYETKK